MGQKSVAITIQGVNFANSITPMIIANDPTQIIVASRLLDPTLTTQILEGKALH